jgi:hypothetical protein
MRNRPVVALQSGILVHGDGSACNATAHGRSGHESAVVDPIEPQRWF